MLNLCLRWHILRLVEVTFKVKWLFGLTNTDNMYQVKIRWKIYLMINPTLVAFACNVKSFAIAFLSFSPSLYGTNWQTEKSRISSLKTLKIVSNPWQTMRFTFFMVTSIHSIKKSLKNRNSETRWKVAQKIQPFEVRKDGEIESINKNVRWKIQEKLIKRRIFLTSIWLLHGQLWAIIEGAASLTWC